MVVGRSIDSQHPNSFYNAHTSQTGALAHASLQGFCSSAVSQVAFGAHIVSASIQKLETEESLGDVFLVKRVLPKLLKVANPIPDPLGDPHEPAAEGPGPPPPGPAPPGPPGGPSDPAPSGDGDADDEDWVHAANAARSAGSGRGRRRSHKSEPVAEFLD